MVVFPYFTSRTTPFSSIKTSTGKPVKAPLRLVNGLNPYNVLNRGYSFLLDNKNQNISSINDVNIGDKIYSLHSDGKLKLEIYGKTKKDK